MSEYVSIIKSETSQSLSVCFWIEKEKPFKIGEKMYEINTAAYMNGYNWEAFFNYYLPKNHPEVIEGMKTDPEAGTYVAYYPLTAEDEKKAEKFVEIIKELIENEEKLYEVVKNEGQSIEWD
ncbi:MAG: Imm51 family immunity protein [Thermonemataceae bacterium]